MIGASGSVLTATRCFAPWQPAMCWMAPLIPQARYSSGAILVPVWPTCCVCGRQPWLVTTRDTPTVPPSSAASSSSTPKPSGPPTPRPPPTTTRAVASDTPALGSADSTARTSRSLSASSGTNACTARSGHGPGGRGRPAVGRHRQQGQRGFQGGVLEQAAGPPVPGELGQPGRDEPGAGAVGRHRLAGDCAHVSP